MKIKLINSNYNKETGISTATISTDLGTFNGVAKLHKEDKEIESSFAGCQYAETRAFIKYMKQKVKNLDIKIEGLENCIKALKNKKDYEHNSSENRTIRKQLYLLKREKSQWTEKIKSLNSKMLNAMNKRETFINKIKHEGDENK